MALGTMTVGTQSGKMPTQALRCIPMSFDGDDDYTTGGTPGFQTSVQDALEEAVTVLGVVTDGACGGYVPRYIASTGALMILEQDADAGASSGLIEIDASADVSTTTFNVVVLCY